MDIEKEFEKFVEEDEAYGGTKKWKKGQNKMKKAGITLQKKDKFSGYVEDVEEASTYRDKARDDEKKKKRHFAFGGKKDKTRHGAGGYGKGEEVEEGIKDLPPHLQKSLKEFEKKQKALKKQFPELKTKTFVYNPETGKPDIEVKEDYDKNQLLRVKHDEALIAEAGDICALNRGVLRSKSMQAVWEKKCAPKLNNQTLGEKDMEKLVDTVRRVLVGEDSDKDDPGTQGDKAEYQKKRKEVAKKFGVESCSALKDEAKRKECYNALDKAHVADHEEQVKKEEVKDVVSKILGRRKEVKEGVTTGGIEYGEQDWDVQHRLENSYPNLHANYAEFHEQGLEGPYLWHGETYFFDRKVGGWYSVTEEDFVDDEISKDLSLAYVKDGMYKRQFAS